jgi:hypothetical protein
MATVHRLVQRRKLWRQVAGAARASWRRYVLAGLAAIVLLAVVTGGVASLPVYGLPVLASTFLAVSSGLLGGLWMELRRSRPASVSDAQVAWTGAGAVGTLVAAIVMALIWTQSGPELVLPGAERTADRPALSLPAEIDSPEETDATTDAATPPPLVLQPAAADMEWGTFDLGDGTRYRVDGGACPAPGADGVPGDRTPTGGLQIAMNAASGHQAVVKVGDGTELVDPEQVGMCGSRRDALGRTPGQLAMRATIDHTELGTPAGQTTEISNGTCVGVALRLVKERAGANRDLPAVAYWVYFGHGLSGQAFVTKRGFDPEAGRFDPQAQKCER